MLPPHPHRRRALVAAAGVAALAVLAPVAVRAATGPNAGADVHLHAEGGAPVDLVPELNHPSAVDSPEGGSATAGVSVPGLDAAATVAVDPPTLDAGPTAGPPECGDDDHPETGVQGDVPLADQQSGEARRGYSCGLSLVGASTLGGRGGNANMAWIGDCAYVAGDGVAVVDVADPRNPVLVDTLHGTGSDDTLETIATVDAPGRQLLAAARYGFFFNFDGSRTGPVDLYDVSDCRHPRLLTTYVFPGSVHNLTFTPDGRTLWSTLPLQAADVTDPAHPVFIGSLEDQLRMSGPFDLEYAHMVTTSPDGKRLYIGGQLPGQEQMYVFDVSHWPERPARLLSRWTGPGHSVSLAAIGGREYVLHADESIVAPTSNGCLPDAASPAGGASEPILTDVSDRGSPRDVGMLQLEINQPEHCPDALASGVNGSTHYQDVDDPSDTTFAMVSSWNSGLRIFDVRDPAHPTEVAYFNPGQYDMPNSPPDPTRGFNGLMGNMSGASRGIDTTWAHIRYRPETGQIWLTTQVGGFWVLDLQPQVRDRLGLVPMPSVAPEGGPIRPAAGAASSSGPPPDAAAGSGDAFYYCTLGRTGLALPLPG